MHLKDETFNPIRPVIFLTFFPELLEGVTCSMGKYVLLKIFNFRPTFGVLVTLFLRYGCFDMAYENKAFLTNSVIPRPNGNMKGGF